MQPAHERGAVAASHRRCQRRGALYVLLVGVAMLVLLVGISALTVARLGTYASVATTEVEEARVLALSAIEHLLSIIYMAVRSGHQWRLDYASGIASPEYTLGNGTLWFMVVDENDGLLSDSKADPLRAYGVGSVGASTQVYSVLMLPVGQGMDVLRTGLHSAADVVVTDTVTVVGGPLSTNANLSNYDTINADVEAAALPVPGTINGTITVPAPPKEMPAGSLFDEVYRPLATVIAWAPGGSGTWALRAPLLSPAVNPWGTPNPRGIYLLSVPAGSTLRLEISRIVGTLLLDVGAGARVVLDTPTLWEPVSRDYPILIARAATGATFMLDNPAGLVEEGGVGANLNPAGTPYNGQWDTDMIDTYPAELRGLLHVIGPDGTVEISGRLVGTLVSDSPVSVQNNTLTVTVDPDLLNRPPLGYAAGDYVMPVPGTLRRTALP